MTRRLVEFGDSHAPVPTSPLATALIDADTLDVYVPLAVAEPSFDELCRLARAVETEGVPSLERHGLLFVEARWLAGKCPGIRPYVDEVTADCRETLAERPELAHGPEEN